MSKLGAAFKAFFAVLKGDTTEKAAFNSTTETAEKNAENTNSTKLDRKTDKKALREHFECGALYTLVLLQREGRLIDFLQENIDAYDDAQIGAAVRRIHNSCAKTLDEYFKLRKIVETPEGESTTVEKNFDPSKYKLVGSVPDMYPFSGVVRHCGWEATSIDLPDKNDTAGKVIFQAEIGF